MNVSSLCTQPLDALRVTALLEFMVDSKNLQARRSQKSIRPMPVPIVRMFPLKETLRMPHPEFREGIFLTDCKVLESRRSVCALLPTAYI